MAFNTHFASGGWRPLVACFALGAMSALALAPFYVWPLLFISLPGLLLALDGAASARSAALRGWAWGFGFFVAGLYWIVIALTVDMARFGWMIPFALLGMNGALALFFALVGWLWFRLRRGKAMPDWLMFVVLFCAAEWLRGHILTGFPWNLLGYVWAASSVSIQAASLMGVYGLTFFTVAAASSVWVWLRRPHVGRLLVAGFGVAVFALLGFGYTRLQSAPVYQGGTLVRIVQANIPQTLKWNPEFTQSALEKHIRMSQQPVADGVDPQVIFWPETAFPYAIGDDSEWPSILAGTLQPHQILVTGAILSEGSDADRRIYNGMVAINQEGEVVARHAKHHLVPFGEYLPLRLWLPSFVTKITTGNTDFTAGKQVTHPLKLTNGIFMSPLICYEVIFPRYSNVAKQKGFLVNLTNDGWYGVSSGPYQHRDMARFRAVEQGMSMVRVAGTGISVAYDGYGRKLAEVGLHKQGIVDVSIPPQVEGGTVYRAINSMF